MSNYSDLDYAERYHGTEVYLEESGPSDDDLDEIYDDEEFYDDIDEFEELLEDEPTLDSEDDVEDVIF